MYFKDTSNLNFVVSYLYYINSFFHFNCANLQSGVTLIKLHQHTKHYISKGLLV